MTYKEAIEQGYRNGDCMYTIGYISRKTDILQQPVQIAGGRRKGQLYVEIPARQTSRYHIRQYLIALKGKEH